MAEAETLALTDALDLNSILLSLIDPKSWLYIVEVIEALNLAPEKKAALLYQLAATFEKQGIKADVFIGPAVLRALGISEESSTAGDNG